MNGPSETMRVTTERSGGVLEPLTVRNTGQRIAERLVTAIALGQYVPGQRLPAERHLAELLKVSRSSVRDALAQLVTSGLVEIRRGRTGGAYVTATWGPDSASMVRRALLPEWERLQQLLDFRCTVESEIARLAAERRTPAEARLVERASDEYLQSDMNREASQRADVALHRAITRAAHNPCWEQLSVQLRHEVNQGLGTEPYSPALRQRAEREHPELAAAVVAGDPDAAASSARRHFGLNGQTIDELLSSLGRDPVPAPSGASRPRRKENL